MSLFWNWGIFCKPVRHPWYRSTHPIASISPQTPQKLSASTMLPWAWLIWCFRVGSVYFFDDLTNHILRSELPRGHYIQITPPFSTDENDTTDYSSVQFALDRFTIRINHSGGAYTKTRKRREEGQRKRREEGQRKRREGQGKRQGKRNTRTHKQKKTRGRTR